MCVNISKCVFIHLFSLALLLTLCVCWGLGVCAISSMHAWGSSGKTWEFSTLSTHGSQGKLSVRLGGKCLYQQSYLTCMCYTLSFLRTGLGNPNTMLIYHLKRGTDWKPRVSESGEVYAEPQSSWSITRLSFLNMYTNSQKISHFSLKYICYSQDSWHT